MLRKAYSLLTERVSDEGIINNYDGIEVARVFKLIESGNQPFGDSTSNEDINEQESSDYPCKWWQIRCHLTQVVREKAADSIILALILLI